MPGLEACNFWLYCVSVSEQVHYIASNHPLLLLLNPHPLSPVRRTPLRRFRSRLNSRSLRSRLLPNLVRLNWSLPSPLQNRLSPRLRPPEKWMTL